jgi:flagellar basal body-associated protein FliL
MKIVGEWLEAVVDTVQQPKNSSSLLLVVLLVLFLGAGSLYMLLNTTG